MAGRPPTVVAQTAKAGAFPPLLVLWAPVVSLVWRRGAQGSWAPGGGAGVAGCPAEGRRDLQCVTGRLGRRLMLGRLRSAGAEPSTEAGQAVSRRLGSAPTVATPSAHRLSGRRAARAASFYAGQLLLGARAAGRWRVRACHVCAYRRGEAYQHAMSHSYQDRVQKRAVPCVCWPWRTCWRLLLGPLGHLCCQTNHLRRQRVQRVHVRREDIFEHEHAEHAGIFAANMNTLNTLAAQMGSLASQMAQRAQEEPPARRGWCSCWF